MINKIVYKFRNSRYYVKQVDVNKLIIIDRKEKYNLEVVNNYVVVNRAKLTPKQLLDYFFNNVKKNQYLFFSFLVINAFLFVFASQAMVLSEDFILLRSFIHYNPVLFIINSIGAYAAYSSVYKLSPRINIITMLAGMLLSTLFILLRDEVVYGSTGILFAFVPFVVIHEKNNMYFNLILIAIAAFILSYIFPFITSPGNLGGYLGGVIVFIFLVKKDPKFSKLFFNRTNKQ